MDSESITKARYVMNNSRPRSPLYARISVLDTGQPRWGDNGGKPLEGTRLCCRPEMYNLSTIMAEDSLR